MEFAPTYSADATDGMPLVSVIICTCNRPEMLRRALRSVLNQQFQDYEVIVVVDGQDEPVAPEIVSSGRVRLVQTQNRGVGAARAAGLNTAHGEFVAYCDDDDEWRPEHLNTLYTYLRNHGDVDLVYGDSEWLFEGQNPSVCYSFDFDVHHLNYTGNFIFATDVMHRREAAQRAGGFDPSLTAHEDWDLWLRMSQRSVLRHLPETLATHNRHAGCVSNSGNWDVWQRVRDKQQALLAHEGVAPGHRLRPPFGAKFVPFDRRTWDADRRELIWHSRIRSGEGYGTVSAQLILALERQGIDITLAPFGNQVPSELERFAKPLDHLGKLAFDYHYFVKPSDLGCERVVTYSMWESTRIPAEVVEEINQSSWLLYVPCHQNVQSYYECGTRIPIKILHHGVDSKLFPFIERPQRDLFTFGSLGHFSRRKGIDVLIRAFQDEFPFAEPVRLLLKTTGSIPSSAKDDPRVTFSGGVVSQDALVEFLRNMDAFVMPSRGEGFGLCGIEAMATGLPLIATDWGGPAEYLNPDDTFPLSYQLVDIAEDSKYRGQWAEPDYEHLRHLMRWLAEHPSEARKKGRLASQRIHREWTWDSVAKQMCDDFSVIAAE
jgi:glycosyltransferase involved in cell wall biosynthesis